MKRLAVSIVSFFTVTQLISGVAFAQRVNTSPAPSADSSAVKIITQTSPSPTQTPVKTGSSPTTTPSSASSSSPEPSITSQVTPTPVVQLKTDQSTPTPTLTNASSPTPNVANTINNNPTPTPLPPVKKVVSDATHLLTAPFDLAMNTLPSNVYKDDQGLTAQINSILLIIAFTCISAGTLLLSVPTVMRFMRHKLSLFQQERKSLPYFAG